jgi:hypothetical protein
MAYFNKRAKDPETQRPSFGLCEDASTKTNDENMLVIRNRRWRR